MEILTYDYDAVRDFPRRVHVGVVGSGNLEVLMEPSPDRRSHVVVTTSVDGFGAIWQAVIDRFFAGFDAAVAVEINDFGATPGMVALRLAQAAEKGRS